MIPTLIWYLIVSLAGLVTFPLAYCLFRGLADRGYAFARSIGLLVWGYVFWLLGSLGILGNDVGGQYFAFAVLLGLGALVARRIELAELRAWWSSRKRYVLGVEALFLVAFVGWAFVRSANPEILGTEKPMEVAFINAIIRSPGFPPNDPWLSGYAISYYYFGYVLVAMLGRLAGIPGSVAFNLGVSLVFALTAIGSYGLVYNLLMARRKTDGDNVPLETRHRSSPLLALFGPLFILVVSNIEGFLEVLHARGFFWRVGPAGEAASRFWSWLDIADLTEPPAQALSWLPRTYGTGNWWWWRASRVVQDYDYNMAPRQIIDEFPFFSYLLADLHPHVLAMPFAFLAMALALNLFLGGARGRTGLPGASLFWNITPPMFLLSALALGGMAFLNTWDWPIYLGFFAGAYVLHQARGGGWNWNRLVEFISLGLALGISGFFLYLPFFLGFSSQAGGLLPSLVYLTRGSHLWVMFAPLLFPLFAFALYLWRKSGDWLMLRRGILLAMAVLAAFTLVSLLLMLAIANLPALASINPLAAVAEEMFLGSIDAPGWAELLGESILRRLIYPGGWITLTLLLVSTLGLLIETNGTVRPTQLGSIPPEGEAQRSRIGVGDGWALDSPYVFNLLLALAGILLVVAPEFFYLRDQFANRMNTIFKFYFQAWLFWGIAAAYGATILLQELRRSWSVVFRVSLAFVLGMSLVYPLLSLWDKTQGFNPPQGLTLDGADYIARHAPDEKAAIDWLWTAPMGVLVEAVRPDGGQYSDFARVAAHSGMPTVLGWIGHQIQWRGGAEEIGSRQADIERLYSTRNWEQAEEVLRKYEIRYIFVGSRERSTYRLFEAKFDRYLTQVFRQGDVVIYEAPW